MVYPTLLDSVSDVARPEWRGTAVGVYRFWRDGGYAVGVLTAGFLSDAFGIPAAIAAIEGLTFLSGGVVARVMSETLSFKANPQFSSLNARLLRNGDSWLPTGQASIPRIKY